MKKEKARQNELKIQESFFKCSLEWIMIFLISQSSLTVSFTCIVPSNSGSAISNPCRFISAKNKSSEKKKINFHFDWHWIKWHFLGGLKFETWEKLNQQGNLGILWFFWFLQIFKYLTFFWRKIKVKWKNLW
jgi:hypothetical protein